MENLVYIHLASSYEADGATNPAGSVTPLKVSYKVNFKVLYRKAWINLLSLALLATMLGVADRATAALRQGSKGPEVAELQQQLRQMGYFNRRATGNFGPLTRDAVIQFQQSRGLTPTGVVNEETEQALRDKNEPATANSTSTISSTNRPTLRRGERSEQVKSLQQLLTNVGVYDGEISGVFDSTTVKAVKQFQRSNGLGVDGIVGRRTWAALADGDTATANQPFDNSPFTSDSSFTGPSAGERIGTRVLRQGDKGEAVTNLQQRLQDLGYYKSRITGNFGSVTKAAVARFQKDNGLRSDGIVDGTTKAALDNGGASVNNFNVSELQQRLKEKGFYQGPINGKYNQQTKAAVRAAQDAYGIGENDILNNEF